MDCNDFIKCSLLYWDYLPPNQLRHVSGIVIEFEEKDNGWSVHLCRSTLNLIEAKKADYLILETYKILMNEACEVFRAYKVKGRKKLH